jgi:hypothetical protein
MGLPWLGVVALAAGWCPVGTLGCRLSTCSQDVVSFIEIEMKGAKKQKKAPVEARGEPPALFPSLVVIFPCCWCLSALLLPVLFGLLVLLWLL